MRLACETIGTFRQRGFMLRCFLSISVATFGVDGIAPSAFAQVDCFAKTLTVSGIKGRVFDPSGKPVPKVEVSLKRDSDMAILAITDSNGDFSFSLPVSSGDFSVEASASGFSPAFARVKLQHGILSVLHRNRMLMILGVGGMEPCPSATTNKAEFLKAIHDLDSKK